MEKDKKCKIAHLGLEIIQWALIVTLCFLLLKMFPKAIESQSRNDDFRKEEMYKQIYNDQRIHKLKQENQALTDSIQAINENEECTGIHYIVVRDTIYIGDTIFFKQ